MQITCFFCKYSSPDDYLQIILKNVNLTTYDTTYVNNLTEHQNGRAPSVREFQTNSHNVSAHFWKLQALLNGWMVEVMATSSQNKAWTAKPHQGMEVINIDANSTAETNAFMQTRKHVHMYTPTHACMNACMHSRTHSNHNHNRKICSFQNSDALKPSQ